MSRNSCVCRVATSRNALIVCLLGLGLCAASARADVILGAVETWGDGTGGDMGWASENGIAGVSTPGQANSYLRIEFPQGEEPPNPEESSDVIYTLGVPAVSLFTGNYVASGAGVVSFSFLAEDAAPSDLELRFSANGHEWSYNLTPGLGWTSYSVPLTYAGWADGPGTDGADFLADLEAVDWIGIYIQRSGTDPQDFGLDDFGLPVPEPGEMYLLITAISGLTFSFRKRVRSVLSLVRITA